MDTSVKSTGCLMIQGQEALGYVRACSADPGKLASVFERHATFSDVHNEITLPPIDMLFETDENATEFTERLRRLGFRVFCSMDATYIGWRSITSFPNAREAAEQTVDALHPLTDKCIRETKQEIEAAIAKYAYDTVIMKIMGYEDGVQTEVLIFLKNSGYEVKKYYEHYGDCMDGGSYHSGYSVSWRPAKVVRDIEVVPWWKFWRKK